MTATTAAEKPPISLREIFSVFFWIGVFSFGGGLTGWVYREVVTKRGWMSDDEILSGIALAQVLPGANVTNLTVFVGNRLRGYSGAAIALTALISPPLVMCVLALSAYGFIQQISLLHAAVDGVAAAAVGLNIRLGIVGAVRVVRRVGPTITMLATFIAVGVLNWPLVPVVLIIAPLSIASVWPWKRNNG